ncbi:MAG TPA: hypothetical protein V6D47_16420 [Oscillatoriaceae cyanobacterium]
MAIANFSPSSSTTFHALDLPPLQPPVQAPAQAPAVPMPVAQVAVPPGLTPQSPAAGLPSLGTPTMPAPANTLQIGDQYFSNVRALAPGMSPQQAAQLTAADGIDEIYFTDDTGQHYVAYQQQGHFSDVRVGYMGRFNGRKITVDAVDDENNTFGEGVQAVFTWAKNLFNGSFGSVANNTATGLITTGAGTLMAAAALKNGVQAGAPLIQKGFLTTIGGAARGAMESLFNTTAIAVLFIGTGLGAAALVSGVRAKMTKVDYAPLDMVIGNY